MTKLFIEKTTVTPTPKYATKYSAAMDIHAVIKGNSGVQIIAPHQTVMIETGLKVQPEAGYHVELYPRSGLAAKLSINLANCLGLIDRDYKNELRVLLHNNSTSTAEILDGERICQMQIKKTEQIEIVEVNKLPELESDREGGFGHSGRM